MDSVVPFYRRKNGNENRKKTSQLAVVALTQGSVISVLQLAVVALMQGSVTSVLQRLGQGTEPLIQSL